jgi:hypothetical protein
MSTISRRQMIAGVGGVIVGGAVATALPAMAAPSNFAATAEWIPHKVDPAIGERFGYDGYYNKGYGCCYGAFYAIVGQMAEQHGAPYKAGRGASLRSRSAHRCTVVSRPCHRRRR